MGGGRVAAHVTPDDRKHAAAISNRRHLRISHKPMATLFSHPLVPLAMGLGLGPKTIPYPLLWLGAGLSMLPDVDVIAFRLGIPYASPFGHRGFTHSITAAFVVAVFCCLLHRHLRASRLTVLIFCWFAMVSHPLLDALTDGGLGVALLWPFSNQRFFFPWHPISVSRIGHAFFSAHGWAVLRSELYSVWMPCIAVGLMLFGIRKVFSKPDKTQ